MQFQDKNAPVHVSPVQGPPGTPFDITFQTLQAGQPFYLYRKVGCGQVNRCEWEFVAALQAQQRDAAGSVTYRLPTHRGDPPGHYLAWDRSTPPGVLGFFPAGSFVLEDGATAQSTPTPGIRGLPTRAAPLAPGKLAPSVPSGALTPTSGLVALRARIVSPPAGTTTVTKELAFQVEAYDEKVGLKDGAGIDRVEMFVIDNKNRIVHKRTDTSAAYCAFGGGEPKCTVYDFGGHRNLWSDDTPIGGAYTLRAVVYGKGGATSTVETKVTLKP